MDVTNEVNELAARIAALPDDAQLDLAGQVFRRFGWHPVDQAKLDAEMLAERQALFASEKVDGKAPMAEYRAVG